VECRDDPDSAVLVHFDDEGQDVATGTSDSGVDADHPDGAGRRHRRPTRILRDTATPVPVTGAPPGSGGDCGSPGNIAGRRMVDAYAAVAVARAIRHSLADKRD
jgi:hypothetical protein